MSINSVSAPRPSLEQMLGDMRGCAQHFERGQADMPLTAQVEALIAPQRAGAITMLLAASGAELASRAVAWLTGTQAPMPAGSVPAEIPLVVDGIPTRILVLELDSGASHAPALLARMLHEPSLLVVAFTPGQAMAPSARETLDLLASNCCGHLQLCFQDAPGTPAILPMPGHLVARMAVTPGQPQPVSFFDARSNGLRNGLNLSNRVRRALTLYDLMHEREQTELRLLQTRQKRDQRAERPPAGGDGDVRRLLETLRSSLNEEIGVLAQDLRERGRRAGLRNGEVAAFNGQLIESLRPDDIEQEETGRKIKLRLRETVEDELKERFAENLRSLVAGDVAAISAALQRIRSKAGSLVAFHKLSIPAVAPPSLQQFWGPMEEALHIDVRYRGELPKRGLLQRLGQGRRVIFVFLMMGSLVGGFMGFNVRRAAGMGPVFLVLFLIVVGYTFFSWKKEDSENMENELSKVRDILSLDFSRLLQDALRERQSRLQTWLDEMRREWLLLFDAVMRDAAAGIAGESENERKAARGRLKAVETRLRELQAMAQTTARLRPALERALAEARAAIAAPELPQSAP